MGVLFDADDFALYCYCMILLRLLFLKKLQRRLDLGKTAWLDLRLVQTARQLLRELHEYVVLLHFYHWPAHAGAHG